MRSENGGWTELEDALTGKEREIYRQLGLLMFECALRFLLPRLN